MSYGWTVHCERRNGNGITSVWLDRYSSLPIVRSLHDVEVLELSSLAAAETATGVRGNSGNSDS